MAELRFVVFSQVVSRSPQSANGLPVIEVPHIILGLQYLPTNYSFMVNVGIDIVDPTIEHTVELKFTSPLGTPLLSQIIQIPIQSEEKILEMTRHPDGSVNVIIGYQFTNFPFENEGYYECFVKFDQTTLGSGKMYVNKRG